MALGLGATGGINCKCVEWSIVESFGGEVKRYGKMQNIGLNLLNRIFYCEFFTVDNRFTDSHGRPLYG